MKVVSISYREIPEKKILEFPATPGFKGWRPFFTGESITHPAKMNLNLLRWIIETYTEPGEVVLDPMAGTGSTIILASLLGRHGVAVEYESRFCDMIRANIKLTERQTTLIPKGRMICIQGDSRELSKLLERTDAIVTSPPYSLTREGSDRTATGIDVKTGKSLWSKTGSEFSKGNIQKLPHGNIDSIITSPPFGPSTKGGGIFKEGYKAPGEEKVSDPGLPFRHARPLSDDPRNIDNLEYGESVDSIITSPPYAHGLRHRGQSYEETRKKLLARGYSEEYIKASWSQPHQCQHWAEEAYGEDEKNIGNLPHADIDTVVTSPPYEGSRAFHDIEFMKSIAKDQSEKARKGETKSHYKTEEAELRYLNKIESGKIEDPDNIGSMKSETYLEAMLTVYRECYKVLRDQGKLILVTKNFIRDKQVVRLDLDTIKLCEAAGFRLTDRWYFKQPTRSFWRILYKKRFPNAPDIEYEDIMVFSKEEV